MQAWDETYAELQRLLRVGVTSCVKNNQLAPSKKDKYFISGTKKCN